MANKLTTETFIDRCIKKHGEDKYDYSEVVYTKSKDKVKIFCKACNEFFLQAVFEHSNSGHGCPKCGVVKRNNTQRMTKEEFISRSEVVHGKGSYDYSLVEYKRFHENVEIKCNRHGIIFLQSPSNHLLGKTGCKICKSEKISTKNSDTTESFVRKAIQKFGNCFDYSEVEYKSNSVKVKIKCNKHDTYFLQTPNGHLSGRIGCLECQNEADSPLKKDSDLFIEKATTIHGNGKFDYSLVEYDGAHEKVKIRCLVHGTLFEQTPANHYASISGCPDCFKEHKINFHPNKITNDEFISRSKVLFGDFYDYSLVDLSGSRESRKVTLICPVHGVFEQDIYSHLAGVRSGCCVGRNKTTEAFVEEVISVHGDAFDFSGTEYKNTDTKVSVTCKVCGNNLTVDPSILLAGHGCPNCADYGFNPSKPATLYIHSISGKHHDFTGFGITRNIKSRTRNHTKNLNREGYSIINSFTTDELNGKFIQQLEKVLKETFPLDANTAHISGFKTESTTTPYNEVVDFVRQYIENNNKEPYGDN